MVMLNGYEKNSCRVEFTVKGLEITGPCAKGFMESFEELYDASENIGREISAYACVDPGTGSVNKLILGKVGSATETTLPLGRVCPIKHRQISMHTHPTSGVAKFSNTDAITVAHRMNEGQDDASCVIGKEMTQCLIRSIIPRGKTAARRQPLT
ncbi:MAG: hypothetical protein OK439_00125 [Thaumarchaeota archaeon]|nr:hypothetical protein [Nitrososphaerota archaeon]